MTKTKQYFESLDPKPDFPKMERELLEHWYSDGIVDKYLNKNRVSVIYSEQFIFLLDILFT